jgi:hypothetical protein
MYLAPKNEAIILLDRPAVERKDIASALKVLSAFSANAELARKHANALTIVIEGYEADPRQLYDIKPVRDFVQQLTLEWPYWLHFINKADHTLLVIMKCLMEITRTSRDGGIVTSTLAEGEFSRIIGDLFGGMNYLYQELGLTSEENSAMTQEIKRYLDSLETRTR